MTTTDFLTGNALTRVETLRVFRSLTALEATPATRSQLAAHMALLNAAASDMTADDHADVFLYLQSEADAEVDLAAKKALCLLASAEAGLAELKCLDDDSRTRWADSGRMMQWHAGCLAR